MIFHHQERYGSNGLNKVKQLRNHIPLGGPATREPADGTESPLRISLGFTPKWYHDRLGIDFSEQWHTNPVYRYESLVAMKEYLHEHFPYVPYFTPAYEKRGSAGTSDTAGTAALEPACATVSGVFGILFISMLYGAEPVYSKDGWPDAKPDFSKEYLDKLISAGPLQLEQNKVFRQFVSQMDSIRRKWGRVHGYMNYQGILNIAAKLRGSAVFIDMIDDPEFTKRFFSHIAGTILQAAQYIQQKQRDSGFSIDLLSMSNCTVSMISPQQYEEFNLPLDSMLGSHFDAFGIHTCNWVIDPYIDSLRNIQKMGYIDTGINSDLRRVRDTFPEARRAVLLTPGEIEKWNSDDLVRIIRKIHAEYSPCDIVLADIETTMSDDRIREFFSLRDKELENG